MKKFIEKLFNFLPHTTLIIIILAVTIFFIKYGLHYDQLVGLISVLIWPSIVLCALIFFRKVFTYLFFSMDEFNFFGNRGSLKNIQDVIEERVQRELELKQEEEKNKVAFNRLESDLKNARLSKEESDQKAENNLKLAGQMFEELKNISDKYQETIKELTILQEEKRDRENRHLAIMERIRERRDRDRDRDREEVIDEIRRRWKRPSDDGNMADEDKTQDNPDEESDEENDK